MTPRSSGRGSFTLPRVAAPLLLVLPLLAFTLTAFALPLSLMLWRAVDSPEFVQALPRTAEALRTAEAGRLPERVVAATLTEELAGAGDSAALGRLALRLNAQRPGTRSVLTRTARELSDATLPGDPIAALAAIDPAWGDPKFWAFLKQAASPLTDRNLLASLDLARGESGAIERVPSDSAIYLDAAWRTFAISATVTLICLLLGYPFAFFLASGSGWTLGVFMACLMLPFWTSILVRTTAWVVLLQNEGLINKALIAAHFIDAPLALIRNRTGVVIAMTHVLLPFMVLPLIGVMRAVPANLLRASAASGAKGLQTFVRVYWPLTLPGVGAGGLLVFIQSVGYFITPALVGGPNDQMLGYFVALHTNETLDWGMASALGAMLLVAVLALYLLWTHVAPSDGGLG